MHPKLRIMAIAFCFCLLPCNQTWGVEADSKAYTSPFAATGLTTHPAETAEEILTRAHARDARAILLTSAGYALGIGGFSKDDYLASGWAAQLLALGLTEDFSLAVLIIWADNHFVPETLGSRLADCTAARKSLFSSAFRNARIFDIQSMCSTLEAAKAKHPIWKKQYDERLASWETIKKQSTAARELARSLQTRRATEKELAAILRNKHNFTPDMFIFFAATTHDPGKMTPDWSIKRLTAFLLAQSLNTEAKKESAASVQDHDELAQTINAAIINTPGGTPSVMSLMQKAHCGDAAAAHEMAMRYTYGTAGFIRDKALARYWLQHSALIGDPTSTLSMATTFYATQQWPEAWAWADILPGMPTSTPEQKTVAKALADSIEKRFGEIALVPGRSLVLKYLEEKLELLKYHEEGRKKLKK